MITRLERCEFVEKSNRLQIYRNQSYKKLGHDYCYYHRTYRSSASGGPLTRDKSHWVLRNNIVSVVATQQFVGIALTAAAVSL